MHSFVGKRADVRPIRESAILDTKQACTSSSSPHQTILHPSKLAHQASLNTNRWKSTRAMTCSTLMVPRMPWLMATKNSTPIALCTSACAPRDRTTSTENADDGIYCINASSPWIPVEYVSFTCSSHACCSSARCLARGGLVHKTFFERAGFLTKGSV